jgi:acyl-CoA thioesterase
MTGSVDTLGVALKTEAEIKRLVAMSPSNREFEVNVKATLSPDDLARACAGAMWKEDDASQGLGMEIVEVAPGKAVMSMTVQPHMVNGQRIAHGGFIFTLADSAFAFACNTHNERVVAAQGNITFIRPGKLGDLLVATAREISRSGRSGIYDVRVTVDSTVIAEFRGHSRVITGTWLPVADAATKQQ